MTRVSTGIPGYDEMVADRARLGAAPLPLNATQMQSLAQLLQENQDAATATSLLTLLSERVPAGVDPAAKVKAAFLGEVATGKVRVCGLNVEQAVELLGMMKGGYNVPVLMDLLQDEKLAPVAAQALSRTLLIYDAFDELCALSKNGNQAATQVLKAYADATWFTEKEALPQCITLKVFKVAGEVTTDDLSPATDAWSRADIPLHALAMFKNSRPDVTADVEGVRGPMQMLERLKQDGYPLCYVGDVVGTGSSRTSAANS